jgi:bacterioferritin-associated ferredoxin
MGSCEDHEQQAQACVVDRCCCAGVTFAELLALVNEREIDFDLLMKRTGCGQGCGLCEPYAREALRTGRGRVPL